MKREDRLNASRSAQLWTCMGAALFLMALLGSALAIPGLRILHSLQALIYIAVIVLARRDSLWGYGAGFAIAIVWDGVELVAHVMQRDAVAVWSSLRIGHVPPLVPMTVVLGGAAHFILIVAALFALIGHKTEARKWWKFAGGGVLSIAYFALIVAFARPH
jgi:drug/metabolite transporter (DMT)-like permease